MFIILVFINHLLYHNAVGVHPCVNALTFCDKTFVVSKNCSRQIYLKNIATANLIHNNQTHQKVLLLSKKA